MSEEEERNKKLAQWAIPAALEIDVKYGRIWIETDEGTGVVKDYFTRSLDACLKILAPAIEDRGLTLDCVSFKQASGSYYAEWKIYKAKDQIKCGELLAKDWQMGTDLEKITALAFCLATERLIDGEEGK